LALPFGLVGAIALGAPAFGVMRLVPMSVPGAWLAFLGGAASYGLIASALQVYAEDFLVGLPVLGGFAILGAFELGFYGMWLPRNAEDIRWLDLLSITVIGVVPPLASALVTLSVTGRAVTALAGPRLAAVTNE
jgi:hypothetical protein